MWNDFEFHAKLLDILGSEQKAFRWLFTPRRELNHRTPIEVLSDGGIARVSQVLEETINEKNTDTESFGW